MRQKKYYFGFLLISLIFYYCSKISDVEYKHQIKIDDGGQEILVIPDSIISKANTYVISKVGERFFNSYIKYNSEKSKYSAADSFCIEHPSKTRK